MKKFLNVLPAIIIFILIGIASAKFVNTVLPDDPVDKIPVPQYTVGSHQEYVQQGYSGIAYRVFTADDLDSLSDDQLKAIYKDVIKKDSYLLHTVWFYRDKVYAINGGVYDAMIEEVVETTKVNFVRR